MWEWSIDVAIYRKGEVCRGIRGQGRNAIAAVGASYALDFRMLAIETVFSGP